MYLANVYKPVCNIFLLNSKALDRFYITSRVVLSRNIMRRKRETIIRKVPSWHENSVEELDNEERKKCYNQLVHKKSTDHERELKSLLDGDANDKIGNRIQNIIAKFQLQELGKSLRFCVALAKFEQWQWWRHFGIMVDYGLGDEAPVLALIKRMRDLKKDLLEDSILNRLVLSALTEGCDATEVVLERVQLKSKADDPLFHALDRWIGALESARAFCITTKNQTKVVSAREIKLRARNDFRRAAEPLRAFLRVSEKTDIPLKAGNKPWQVHFLYDCISIFDRSVSRDILARLDERPEEASVLGLNSLTELGNYYETILKRPHLGLRWAISRRGSATLLVPSLSSRSR